jgi:hypothetical protein
MLPQELSHGLKKIKTTWSLTARPIANPRPSPVWSPAWPPTWLAAGLRRPLKPLRAMRAWRDKAGLAALTLRRLRACERIPGKST